MALNTVFVVYPGIKLLDLAGPLQVFSDAVGKQGNAAYKNAIVSKRGENLATDTVIGIASEAMSKWRKRRIDTLFIVGGDSVYSTLDDDEFISCVKTLAKKSRRVAAICTGAFILAECGLLEDCKVVTHWESCSRLKDAYPQLEVIEDAIYLNEGKYWTSAGVTAGIDMALQMVSEDLGKPVALSIAQSLVTYLVRPGGQSQFSQPLTLQLSDSNGRFHKLNYWIQNHLNYDLRNEALAGRACMSTRTFARLYSAETGTTPAKAVELMRVEAACRMLTQSNTNINKIARSCGFIDDERMRRAFHRQVKISPQEYRSRFSATTMR